MIEKCVFERNGYCTCITCLRYKCDDESTCEKRHPKINKDSDSGKDKNTFYFDGASPELLRQLIKDHGKSGTMFTGTNSEGEMMTISISSEEGIITNTYQNNGWVRVNYYDVDGICAGETFDGRWR